MDFGSQKGTSKSTSNTNSSSSATPNNLASLQQGWNLADNLLAGTSGNSTATANQALDLLKKGALTASDAATGGLSTATGFANGGTANAANQYLTPFANGSMTGNNNPYFDGLVQQLGRSLQPVVDGNFAAAGRYGSGANANAFNTALTNEAGQLGYTNFNDSLNRQVGAAGQLSTNNAGSTNAALAALGLVPGLSSTAADAGSNLYGGATAPLNTFANVLSLLGGGGGTTTANESNTSTGKASGTGFGFDLSKALSQLGL